MEQQGQVSWGVWQIAEAEETICDLYVRVKGYEPITIPNLRLERGKEAKNVNIRPVRRTGSVSGRVRDEQGNPVAGGELGLASFTKTDDGNYRVDLGASGLDVSFNRLTPIAISQRDGSFTLEDVVEGFHTIIPTPKTEEAWKTKEPWDFEDCTVVVPRGQFVKDIDITVKPNQTIYLTGRILQEDGVTPIANAQLKVRDVWKHKKGTGSGDSSGSFHTDAEGRYEFRFSNPGAYEITIYSPDGTSAMHKIEAEESARIEGLDFVMPKQEKRAPALRGRVLGYDDKKPIGGGHCEVAVTGKGELYFANAKEDGAFEIAKLEDGEYAVRVDILYFSKYIRSDAKLLPESEAKVNVVDGYGGEVTLYLPRGVTISGRVISETDGSLIQQPVEISRKMGEPDFRHRFGYTNGKYAHPHGLPPGTYVFRASSEGYKPAERTIEIKKEMLGREISDFDFHLKYEGFVAISGVVTLADGKTPATGALVAILKDETKVRDYKTVNSSDGRFLLENLPAGRYTLLVTAPGFPPQTEAIEVKADEPVLEVRIKLVKDGTIELHMKES